jgi:hypothetical protein
MKCGHRRRSAKGAEKVEATNRVANPLDGDRKVARLMATPDLRDRNSISFTSDHNPRSKRHAKANESRKKNITASSG